MSCNHVTAAAAAAAAVVVVVTASSSATNFLTFTQQTTTFLHHQGQSYKQNMAKNNEKATFGNISVGGRAGIAQR